MLRKEKLRADASKRNTPKESFDQNVTASSERRHFEAVPDEVGVLLIYLLTISCLPNKSRPGGKF